ncbi:hypothetical protein, partial [Serratia bockelmannii]|uniref:hypothetical protein n=1 Tax=Serratia bockelmannii TaxID=2703793 RepID=UPI003FA74577
MVTVELVPLPVKLTTPLLTLTQLPPPSTFQSKSEALAPCFSVRVKVAPLKPMVGKPLVGEKPLPLAMIES